ncbi:MAG: hypothetical protein PHF12_05770 [Candidatus Omnitrophica bacterium]|jgi:hypothetical protein|nr:hypothetical protein [Candidatus Omnitrophota bacterium]
MADKDDNKGVIPSGSKSVFDTPDDRDNGSTKDDKAEPKGKAADTPKDTGKKADDASPDKSYTELKKLYDRQANELGEMRKMVTSLQVAQEKPDTTKTADKRTKQAPVNDELTKVFEEFGSLDFYEDDGAGKKAAAMLKKAVGLTAQMVRDETLAEAENSVRNILQEKDTDTVTNKFLEQNPDYTDLQSQGVFQAFKAKNPLHDDFSAYYAHKADSAMQRVTELESELEEARKVANLAGGDEKTSKVFTKPGNELRARQQPKPKSVSELKQSAFAAVMKATGAG